MIRHPSIVHSPWDRPTGDGHHVIDPYKGVVIARDTVLLSEHPGIHTGDPTKPRQEGWVRVLGEEGVSWARIRAIEKIGADIVVANVTPFKKWVVPLNIPRWVPKMVLIFRNGREPEWWRLDLKGGHDKVSARLWLWPDTERDEMRPGDSGLPALAKGALGWRVIGHNKAGNDQVGYLTCYVDRRSQIMKAKRRLRKAVR